jgi:hypothetical protein
MHPLLLADLVADHQARLLAEAAAHRRRPAAAPEVVRPRPLEASLIAEISAVQDDIAHLVASAVETGGRRWDDVASILDGYLDRGFLATAPAVVVGRGLARVQRRERRMAERAVAAGDCACALVLAGRLGDLRAALTGDPGARTAQRRRDPVLPALAGARVA